MKNTNHIMLALLSAVMTLQIPFAVSSTYSASQPHPPSYRANDSTNNVDEPRTNLQSSYGTSKNWDGEEEARIVGGHNAVKGRYPYMVSLQSTSRHECGAVLVAPDVILTAAHCASDYIVKAIVGRYDLDNDDEVDSQTINLTSYVKHPNNVLETDQFDVGLFKLMEPTNLPPVILNRNSSLLQKGMVLTVMGFGDLGNQSYPPILQEAQVNYIPNDDCRSYKDPLGNSNDMPYTNMILEDMMCALGENKDGCFGDSGGPLVVRGGNNHYEEDVVVGITSWGIGCARLPGVYARVDYMYDWITTTICSLSQDAPDYLQCLPPSSETDAASTPTPTYTNGRDGSSLSSPPPNITTPTFQPTNPPTVTPASTLSDTLDDLDNHATSSITRLCLWGSCLLLQMLTVMLVI